MKSLSGPVLGLAICVLALMAASPASALRESRPCYETCFIWSMFPESPAFSENAVSVPAAMRDLVLRPATGHIDYPRRGNMLFSEPLSPKRWLGLTAGPTIEQWISYYAEGPGRSYLEKAIARSVPYLAPMERIVKEEGVPVEVIALVYIESGFDMSATSHKRAVGPWQFMPRTAGRFGLRVGKYVDERRDPELSTRAAVRYLKYLYGLFDSWTLAAASYNSGEGRVLRAMENQNTRDFWSLQLPRQTMEFIPKVAAVLAILSDPERYGFNLPSPGPADYDVVEVNGPVTLSAVASLCGSSRDSLEALNPALLRGITPPGSDSFPLRVPPGTGKVCREELSKIRYHIVSRGETLSQIAARYDISVSSVARANAISNPHRIDPGVLLTIPPVLVSTSAAKAGTALTSAAKAGMALASAAGRAVDIIHYTVRPGDSLWRISAKFGTSVAQLARWNGLGDSHKIKPGQVLKVFVSQS